MYIKPIPIKLYLYDEHDESDYEPGAEADAVAAFRGMFYGLVIGGALWTGLYFACRALVELL